MKKSFHKNTNNLLKKRNQNKVNIDNKNIIKYNEDKNLQDKKDFQINKNIIMNNLSSNINNQQRQIKTTKGSPLSINNKILKQISKITTKSINQNIDKIPTIIFNINSNQVFETNYKNIQNSNESKSNTKSKSKSNESNNLKKTTNQCNLIKNKIKKQNNFNAKIIKAKTQIQKIQIKKNNNLPKNIINKNQIKENNSYKTSNPYHFYYTNNQKLNIGTSLSLTTKKNNLVGLQFINNMINKNNANNFKTTPITTKNSAKNSKEKNIKNCNSNHKENNSKDNKKSNKNNKIISMGTKKKINQQKLIIQNNNNLKSLMKKFSISNINKNKKNKKETKSKNSDNFTNSKNITLLGKNSNSNLSSLNNFYSINMLSKSFANSKKNFKKNINFYKTKVDTKIRNNEIQKKSNKYFDINNHNIFPITISHYKNNYININININNKKNNIKTANNICNINKIIKNNSKKCQKNKNSKIKLNDLSKKKTLTTNNTKIMNKINYKYELNDKKRYLYKNNIVNNGNSNSNNLKIKELSCFDLKKINMPITLTSSLLQTESWGKSKEFKKTEFKQVMYINDKEKKMINRNLTNNENNNNINIDLININSKTSEKNDINNNTISNKNELSTISQKDYNYYNEESLKKIKSIKKYGSEHNYNSYLKVHNLYIPWQGKQQMKA